MTKKLTLYFDVVSPYSYFSVHIVRAYREVWKDVEIDFVPASQNILMKETKNKPPMMVAAKGKYMSHDLERVGQDLGIGKFSMPPGFPYNSMKHQRVLVPLKAGESNEDFLNCAIMLWRTAWTEHKDMMDDAVVVAALSSVIPEERVRKYMQQATEKEWKDKLVETTYKLLEQGAYGHPWFEVERDGKVDYWFGNDRYEQIAHFLDVPWHGFRYVAEAQAKMQARL